MLGPVQWPVQWPVLGRVLGLGKAMKKEQKQKEQKQVMAITKLPLAGLLACALRSVRLL